MVTLCIFYVIRQFEFNMIRLKACIYTYRLNDILNFFAKAIRPCSMLQYGESAPKGNGTVFGGKGSRARLKISILRDVRNQPVRPVKQQRRQGVGVVKKPAGFRAETADGRSAERARCADYTNTARLTARRRPDQRVATTDAAAGRESERGEESIAVATNLKIKRDE